MCKGNGGESVLIGQGKRGISCFESVGPQFPPNPCVLASIGLKLGSGRVREIPQLFRDGRSYPARTESFHGDGRGPTPGIALNVSVQGHDEMKPPSGDVKGIAG